MYDIESGNLPSLLRYEDRNSMRFSIETRLPFLDYRIVEHGLSIRSAQKMKNAHLKAPLRLLLSRKTKTGVDKRQDKIGFSAPTDLWIQENEKIMIEIIRSSKLLNKLLELKKDLSYSVYGVMFWRLFIVALWEKEKKLQI